MRVDLFDFELPEELIALRPAVPRDSSRLMIVEAGGVRRHAHFRDLPALLRSGDILVLNNSMVMPARLWGTRVPRKTGMGEGAFVEATLYKRLTPSRFRALVRPAKRLRPGDQIQFGATLLAIVISRAAGEADLSFETDGSSLDEAIEREGKTPLPPYIASRRAPDARDCADYQTIYAEEPGSVAAPTAGLHFTPDLLTRLDVAGISRVSITLHVGPGTFLSVATADTGGHVMASEYAALSEEAAVKLNDVRAKGGRIVAVGSTALRTLESAADNDGRFRSFAGETHLFIVPGYRFRAVDMLLTNFHLPRSTLFMLVSAFSGLEHMKAAYAEAIAEHYRFYSYGDACLLTGARI